MPQSQPTFPVSSAVRATDPPVKVVEADGVGVFGVRAVEQLPLGHVLTPVVPLHHVLLPSSVEYNTAD